MYKYVTLCLHAFLRYVTVDTKRGHCLDWVNSYVYLHKTYSEKYPGIVTAIPQERLMNSYVYEQWKQRHYKSALDYEQGPGRLCLMDSLTWLILPEEFVSGNVFDHSHSYLSHATGNVHPQGLKIIAPRFVHTCMYSIGLFQP